MLAPPSPAKKLSGILITTAHGQLMTRNVQALRIQSPHIAPVEAYPAIPIFVIIMKIGGISASASAA